MNSNFVNFFEGGYLPFTFIFFSSIIIKESNLKKVQGFHSYVCLERGERNGT